MWKQILDAFEQGQVNKVAGIVETSKKQHGSNGYLAKFWGGKSKLAAIDLQWSDMRPGRGLATV